MKVLLTGANGFVGSHLLDRLHADGLAVRLLLRPESDTTFIRDHLARAEVVHGSVTDAASVQRAVSGVTHVIHCAGKTKALRAAEYFTVNQQGTRHVVDAVNATGGVQRLLFISSLAAARPATVEAPAREDDPPGPVSEYGRSKLAGEQELRAHARAAFTILRPAAVYGPRDRDFLTVIRGLRAHVRPSFGGGRQFVSLVRAEELAAAAVACLTNQAAAGRTYNVASPDAVSTEAFTREIARQLGVWTVRVPVPWFGLWLACLLRQGLSQCTRRPHILSVHKFHELRAPGWVCDPTRLRKEVGFVAATPLAKGIAATLQWYREHGWL